MLKRDQIKRVKSFIAHYGEGKQKKQAAQELAELIVAITKDDPVEIAYEVADVYVMLAQIQAIYGLYDESINAIVENKITRQEGRIKKEVH